MSKRTLISIGVLLLLALPIACYRGLRLAEEDARMRANSIYTFLKKGETDHLGRYANDHVAEEYKRIEAEHGRVVSFEVVSIKSKYPDTLWVAEVRVIRDSTAIEIISGSGPRAIHVVREAES